MRRNKFGICLRVYVDSAYLALQAFLGPWSRDMVGSAFLFILKTNTQMSVPFHIGSIIRDELRRQGKTNGWLAEQINVNLRTVNKIFLKPIIDTGQLLQISRIMGVDFFAYYSKLLK